MTIKTTTNNPTTKVKLHTKPKLHTNPQPNKNITMNNPKKEEKEKSYKYRLVGTMIKVILVENGVESMCVKSIPVEKAPPEILAQVENLTMLDLVMIQELKDKEKESTESDKDLPKEHAEYEKHFSYETS